MLLTEGTKVRFLNTGDTGVVTEILSDNMVSVMLDNEDMEIPAFLDNLERVTDTTTKYSNQQIIKPVKAKFVEGKKEYQPPTPPDSEHKAQYTILKSMGIQLAFDPVLRADGTTEKFEIFLLNDTRYDALFTFSIFYKNKNAAKQNGKISSVSNVHLGEMLFDQLNDAPVVEMECWQLTTIGTGFRQHKQIKLKAAQFFKSIKTAPMLDRKVHLFQVFDSFDKEIEPAEEDLKTYTKNNVKKIKPNKNYRNVNSVDPSALAHFENELDLHIENLTNGNKKMSNAEILRLQLSRFDTFLNKAIQLGVDRIFVIHGLGKGKLRNEIATRLMKHPQVKTFKNDHHPKYGFGATEIIL